MLTAMFYAIQLTVGTAQQLQIPQAPLPPTIGLPKQVHEPRDVKVLPQTTDKNK